MLLDSDSLSCIAPYLTGPELLLLAAVSKALHTLILGPSSPSLWRRIAASRHPNRPRPTGDWEHFFHSSWQDRHTGADLWPSPPFHHSGVLLAFQHPTNAETFPKQLVLALDSASDLVTHPSWGTFASPVAAAFVIGLDRSYPHLEAAETPLNILQMLGCALPVNEDESAFSDTEVEEVIKNLDHSRRDRIRNMLRGRNPRAFEFLDPADSLQEFLSICVCQMSGNFLCGAVVLDYRLPEERESVEGLDEWVEEDWVSDEYYEVLEEDVDNDWWIPSRCF